MLITNGMIAARQPRRRDEGHGGAAVPRELKSNQLAGRLNDPPLSPPWLSQEGFSFVRLMAPRGDRIALCNKRS